MKHALVTFKKELGEYCAVCEYVELSMRSMKIDHAKELKDKDSLLDYSKRHNIYLSDCNSTLLSSAVPQYYILNVYRCFETFLQRVYRLIRNYEFEGESFNRKDDESWLECLDRKLKDRLSDETRNLYNICYYYHLIRNFAAHTGKEKGKTERKIAFQRIDRNKCSLEAMFNKLNAPNQEDNIGFDDFVLFSRSSIKLAEEYWNAIRFDYVSLIDDLPEEIIKKWNGHQNNPERQKKEIKRFLEVNYALPEDKFSDDIISAVRDRFNKN